MQIKKQETKNETIKETVKSKNQSATQGYNNSQPIFEIKNY